MGPCSSCPLSCQVDVMVQAGASSAIWYCKSLQLPKLLLQALPTPLLHNLSDEHITFRFRTEVYLGYFSKAGISKWGPYSGCLERIWCTCISNSTTNTLHTFSYHSISYSTSGIAILQWDCSGQRTFYRITSVRWLDRKQKQKTRWSSKAAGTDQVICSQSFLNSL